MSYGVANLRGMDAVRAATGVVVGLWRRRTGAGFDTIRLVRLPDRWLVCRTGCEPQEHANRSLAELAVARIVGDAWVYAVPAQRFRGRVVQ